MTKHLLVLAGSIAFLLAIAWSTVGFVLYGSDMTPNLLAELTGVSVEVAVAALIVDRFMSRHQRREWDFAYRALAERSSEAFVDIMRLMYSRGSATALKANLSRYEHFVQVAQQHLGDLRSHIESSASALDPHTHQQYRRVERRLAWCLEQLRTAPTHADGRSDLLPLLHETAILTFDLLSKDGGGHRMELAAAESSVAKARTTNSEHFSSADIHESRLRAQSALLQKLPRELGPISSISQDVDNDYSIPYFLIDYLLLTRAGDAPK